MADVVYNVRVDYQTNTAAAERGVKTLGDRFSWLSGTLERAQSAFDRVATLAAGGAVAGLAMLTRAVVRLGGDAEGTRLAIAGMMQAGGLGGPGAAGLAANLQVSDELIQRMRVHARDLPGTFEDLMNVFRGGLMGGLAGGMDVNRIEHLSANLMATSKVLGIESVTAGREVAMLLEGRAGGHVALWARLAPLIGKSAQEFNALTNAQRFEAIEKALKGFEPAVAAYANTWDAVSSTAKDHLTDLLRVGGQPLFEAAKASLQRFNAWFERNEESLKRFATDVGTKLAGAFDRVEGIVVRLAGHLRGMSLDTILDKAKTFGGAALVARGALGLAGAVGGGAGIGAAAALGIPIAAAVATGAVDLDEVWNHLRETARPVGMAFEELVTKATPLMSLLGEQLVAGITKVLDGFGALAVNVLEFGSMLTDIANDWRRMLHLGPAQAGTTGDIQGDSRETMLQLQDLNDRGIILRDTARSNAFADTGFEGLNARSFAGATQRAAAAAAASVQRIRPPTVNQTNHVTIHQENNVADDPNRILTATRAGVLQAFHHPIESLGVLATR